jgi:hypothetical protein
MFITIAVKKTSLEYMINNFILDVIISLCFNLTSGETNNEGGCRKKNKEGQFYGPDHNKIKVTVQD